MSFVTVVPNIIVEAVSAAVDIVLDVIDGGFFNDWGADRAAGICRTLL